MSSTRLGSLNDKQIAIMLKGLKNFGGVHANDDLTDYDPKKCYILNLQNEDQPGSHWTALLPMGRYIDSFGFPPTKAITPFVKEYSLCDYQGLNQEDCGYFAIYFCLNQQDPFKNLISNDYAHNYRTLKRFFK